MTLRWRILWYLVYPVAYLFLGLRVVGRRNVPRRGPVLLAANHTSNVDPVIIGLAAGRELHFLAKGELWHGPRFFAWLIEKLNAIPVQRGGVDLTALRRSRAVLRRGCALTLFPEGTRSRVTGFLPYKAGVGFLALGEQVPLVPVYLRGMRRSVLFRVFDRDIRDPALARASGSRGIRVAFGTPIAPQRFPRTKAGYTEFAAEVNAAIGRLAAEKGD